MCSHYEGVRDAQVLRKVFQVEPPANTGKSDLWPGYPGLLIRRPREKDSGDDAVPGREALPGLFGLVPHWATDLKICRSTFNATRRWSCLSIARNTRAVAPSPNMSPSS